MSDHGLAILNPIHNKEDKLPIVLALLRASMRGKDLSTKPFILARMADNVVEDLKKRGFGAKREHVLYELELAVRDMFADAIKTAAIVKLSEPEVKEEMRTGH